MDDAELAARRWERGARLSLGDGLDTDVLTADRTWGTDGRVRQVR